MSCQKGQKLVHSIKVNKKSREKRIEHEQGGEKSIGRGAAEKRRESSHIDPLGKDVGCGKMTP